MSKNKPQQTPKQVPKQKQPQKKSGNKGTRNLVIGMIAFVLLAGGFAAIAKNNALNKVPIPLHATRKDGQGIQFNPTAKVKVDMYEDFRCPNCRNFEAANNDYINGLVKAGKINAVYHTMNFIASDSALTAAAAGCAQDQGKFLEMHTALYRDQPASSQVPENTPYWTNATLITLGHSIGIKSPLFDKCINTGRYAKWATNVNDYATAKNITATPTVLINGKAVPQTTNYDNKAFSKLLVALGVK